MPTVTDRSADGGIDDIAPVEVAPLQTVDEDFRRCNIGCHGNIAHVAQTEHVAFIRLVRLDRHRIAEEEKQIDLIARRIRLLDGTDIPMDDVLTLDGALFDVLD